MVGPTPSPRPRQGNLVAAIVIVLGIHHQHAKAAYFAFFGEVSRKRTEACKTAGESHGDFRRADEPALIPAGDAVYMEVILDNWERFTKFSHRRAGQLRRRDSSVSVRKDYSLVRVLLSTFSELGLVDRDELRFVVDLDPESAEVSGALLLEVVHGI